MQKLSTIFLILIIGLVGTGCDSNSNDDDDVSGADLLAGDWILSGVSDSEGDQLATFTAGFDALDISFTESGSFSIVVDSKDDTQDQTISGTYTVNESASRVTLTTSVAAQQVALNFTYAFNGDNEVMFTADGVTSTLLNVLLGTTLQGSISITVVRA